MHSRKKVQRRPTRSRCDSSTRAREGSIVSRCFLRMLALEIGLNAACRRLDVPIPTGKSWARRGGWELPRRPGGRPQRTVAASSLHPIADALVETHKELEAKTKSGLATAAAKAADHAQSLDGASTFGQSNKLRDLAASAARIFGWDKGPQTNVQVNTLRITAVQLAEIRALRAIDSPTSEGDAVSAITTEE
jgi:hypothetical protein